MRPRSALQQAKIDEAEREARVVRALQRPITEKALPNPEIIYSAISRVHSELEYKTIDIRKVETLASFNRSLKTKDVGKVRLSIANHMFGRYSTPRHLQEVWWKFDPAVPEATNEHRWNRNLRPFLREEERIARERWFVCAAMGGSLYKEFAKEFMTKKEVHTFLTCPLNVSFEEAVLYALASSHTDDLGIKTRIMKSKLIKKRIFLFDIVPVYRGTVNATLDAQWSAFWREVLRFFCLNPLPIHEMNDMLDYISMAAGEEGRMGLRYAPVWTIKGRTVHSLQEATQQWHRDLTRVKRMGNRKWDGVDVADATYLGEVFGGIKTDWTVTQIKTSQELADEGNKMHHCVYSYQQYCISGRTSIWSIKQRPSGPSAAAYERAITLELNNHSGHIVQIRGYANRLARADERNIIQKWAAENGMLIRSW